ncbi:MAG: hypothetical protein KDA21_12400, partial [Phycisphaerales bacterium]|nr:hypothetical protein [Phycisphaerales bacterium]
MAKSKQGPHIVWRRRGDGPVRAYGDFRGLPGGRREPLCRPGTRRATSDPVEAQALFAARLRELADGVHERRDGRITIAEAVRHYLDHRRRQSRVTSAWLDATEGMLGRAVRHFGARRPLASIRVDDVVTWLGSLRSPAAGRGRPYSEESIRKHMNALAGLFRRAQ